MSEEGWVADVYRPKAQRAALLRIADAVGARRKLGEDEAGNPRIEGKFGRVYVQPTTTEAGREPVFQLYLEGGAQRVKFAAAALAFAKVTNKGDEDMLVELKLSDEEVLAMKRELAVRARAAVKNP